MFFLVFGVLTLPFLFFNLDIALQRPFYFPDKGWPMVKTPFWEFIYKYGIFLGYFLAFGALVVVSLSYWKKALVVWRKAAFFMLFVMIVGPGVLVNGTFKDHWGRPRPREITEFNGVQPFHKVWVKGDTKGKSFPCGHASMGFFMSVPFLFLRKRFKKWAWTFFVFGTMYGLLIGYARMIAGGHFASDVLWAAGMVWFTAILGYHLLGIDKPLLAEDFDEEKQKRKGKIMSILLGMFLPFLTLGLLLATPYISKKSFTRSSQELKQLQPVLLKTQFDEGFVMVSFDTLFHTDYTVNGFGFPNSKIGLNWAEGDTCRFWLSKTGWFTEVRNTINVKIPVGNEWENLMELEEGKIYLDIAGDTLPKNLTIKLQEGDVHLKLDAGIQINLNARVPELNSSLEEANYIKVGSATQLQVVIKEGTLFVEADGK